MPHTMQINGGSEAQKTYPLVNQTELLSFRWSFAVITRAFTSDPVRALRSR